MRNITRVCVVGLNFGYRVSLREAGVTYMNKKGKFISDHELECTDAKGRQVNA